MDAISQSDHRPARKSTTVCMAPSENLKNYRHCDNSDGVYTMQRTGPLQWAY